MRDYSGGASAEPHAAVRPHRHGPRGRAQRGLRARGRAARAHRGAAGATGRAPAGGLDRTIGPACPVLHRGLSRPRLRPPSRPRHRRSTTTMTRTTDVPARVKIMCWLVGLMALVLATVVVVVWRLLLVDVDDRVNRALEQETTEFSTYAERHVGHGARGHRSPPAAAVPGRVRSAPRGAARRRGRAARRDHLRAAERPRRLLRDHRRACFVGCGRDFRGTVPLGQGARCRRWQRRVVRDRLLRGRRDRARGLHRARAGPGVVDRSRDRRSDRVAGRGSRAGAGPRGPPGRRRDHRGRPHPPHPVSGRDDIAALARQFNAMLDRLEPAFRDAARVPRRRLPRTAHPDHHRPRPPRADGRRPGRTRRDRPALHRRARPDGPHRRGPAAAGQGRAARLPSPRRGQPARAHQRHRRQAPRPGRPPVGPGVDRRGRGRAGPATRHAGRRAARLERGPAHTRAGATIRFGSAWTARSPSGWPTPGPVCATQSRIFSRSTGLRPADREGHRGGARRYGRGWSSLAGRRERRSCVEVPR